MKEEILKQLKEINEKITEDVMENATKEEIEKYIDLIDSITAKLTTLEILQENK